ncbi:MAG: transporter associated domain-containing protein [Gammaproteobacteria bacterium]
MPDPIFLVIALLLVCAVAVGAFFAGMRYAREGKTLRWNLVQKRELAEHRARLVQSIAELEKTTVDDIMIPRNEIAWIDLNDDWDAILEILRTTPHTRLPVCEDTLDNIVGVLHMKKVAHALARGELTRELLREIAQEREGYFVPEGTTLNVQLLNFQRDRRRVALVVDEYGDIRGLVTLEDILEEIVGEFTTDPATLSKDIHKEADGSFVVTGATTIRILNRTLGLALPTDGPRTLNGLILEYLETIPVPGTSLKIGDVAIEILQTAENSVKTVRLRPLQRATSHEVRSKGVA